VEQFAILLSQTGSARWDHARINLQWTLMDPCVVKINSKLIYPIRFISKSFTRLMKCLEAFTRLMKCLEACYLRIDSKYFLQRAQMQIHDAIVRCQSPPPRKQTPYS